MLITLSLAMLAYFFLYRKYYIRFDSVEGVSEELLVKTFKYEFGLSLEQIKVLVAHTPYVLRAGTFFEVRSLMPKLPEEALKTAFARRKWVCCSSSFTRETLSARK